MPRACRCWAFKGSHVYSDTISLSSNVLSKQNHLSHRFTNKIEPTTRSTSQITNLTNRSASISCPVITLRPPNPPPSLLRTISYHADIVLPAMSGPTKPEPCLIHQVRYFLMISMLTSIHSGLGYALPERLVNGISFTTDPFPRPSSTYYPPTTTVQSTAPATSGVHLAFF